MSTECTTVRATILERCPDPEALMSKKKKKTEIKYDYNYYYYYFDRNICNTCNINI